MRTESRKSEGGITSESPWFRVSGCALPFLAFVLLSADARGQARAPSPGSNRIEVVLERNERDAWQAIDARLILDQGDRVRFRVRTNFSGYLYVTSQGTSGKYEVLFPSAATGRQNKIEAGKEYVVPSTQGSFRVTGPPGQDLVYWLVSPVELDRTDALPGSRPETKPTNAPNLTPRCDRTMLSASGDCIDISAGPKEIAERTNLPAELSRIPNLKSRDLVFIREPNASIISSALPLNGPVIYEFRLAHR